MLFASDVAEMVSFHAFNILPELNGFQGYDTIKFMPAEDMPSWQPLTSAPLDGTEIELLCDDEEVRVGHWDASYRHPHSGMYRQNGRWTVDAEPTYWRHVTKPTTTTGATALGTSPDLLHEPEEMAPEAGD